MVVGNILAHDIFLDAVLVTMYQDSAQTEGGFQLKAFFHRMLPAAPSLLKVSPMLDLAYGPLFGPPCYQAKVE